MKVMTKDRFGNERLMHERVAKILADKGKLTYGTRAMTADPVSPAVYSSAPESPVQEAEEVDSNGEKWDEAVHVSTKLKNADGSWRKRPGARTAE